MTLVISLYIQITSGHYSTRLLLEKKLTNMFIQGNILSLGSGYSS